MASGASLLAAGFLTRAAGEYATAMGQCAQANHDGAFVWADASSNNGFTSTGTNQFLVRAVGGVGLGSNSPYTQLDVERQVSGSAADTGNHVANVENTATSGSGHFAELLPRARESEAIEAGDVVGVFGGEITKRTAGAAQVMVVTDRAMILGNDPGSGRWYGAGAGPVGLLSRRRWSHSRQGMGSVSGGDTAGECARRRCWRDSGSAEPGAATGRADPAPPEE